MRTLIFFAVALTLAGFAQLEDPRRHIDDINLHAQTWFNKSSTVRYQKIVRHSEHDTKDGGKVCYRAIHVAYVDVVCLGWDNKERRIVLDDEYRIKTK